MDKITGVEGGLLQLEPRVGGLRARVTPPYSCEVSATVHFSLSILHGTERDKFVSISTRCSRSRSLTSGSTFLPHSSMELISFLAHESRPRCMS